MKRPRPGEFYRHFKGNTYQIVAIAKDAENMSEQVVYQALYGTYEIYVRPLEEFMEKLDPEKYPETAQATRFELVQLNGTTVQQEIEDADSREVSPKQSSVDEIFLQFLDADTSEEKLELLYEMKDDMDSRIVNNIAASMDLPVDEEDIEGQFAFIEQNLKQRIRFECTRFRN